jgi:hypothetical protein
MAFGRDFLIEIVLAAGELESPSSSNSRRNVCAKRPNKRELSRPVRQPSDAILN